LERPTNAISGKPSEGSADGLDAPAMNRASAAKSRRPASAKLESTAPKGTIGEKVVPGGPKGAGPEPMNTGLSSIVAGPAFMLGWTAS
jgi:hypothetical protein